MKPSPAIRSGRIDFKRSERALYHAPTGSFELDVPEHPPFTQMERLPL
ncbi:hypothetical protein [Stenotrophomonas forensis]|uniref:Uncharacterized protein n=1 Tax=Stenotrophomonas forensis TaxID=2871169 RepID=A0ABY7Y4D5_9GAMM|nr:hypothetical protein [Stenotrophomonas sp. DFS-20110405]WDM64835.1 hypothetical protein K5L94_05975 [Stenotrophomonas sp. DFS-20110405]